MPHMAYRAAMATVDYRTQTTLLTGASSGIGVALARELAVRGSDLVLVARRGDRLERMAAELNGAHGVRVEAIVCDLSEPDAGTRLAREVKSRNLSVTSLVNNAGFGLDGAFADHDPARLSAMLTLNVVAVVDITRAFLAELTSSGTGFLVNVASLAAYQPIPGMAAYSASKTFVLNFTEALWWETRGTGLRTMAFSPGLTRTEFFDELGTAQYDGAFQTPEQVATAMLRAIDRRRPAPSALSRRSNVIATWVSRVLARRATVRATARFAGSDRLMRRDLPSPV